MDEWNDPSLTFLITMPLAMVSGGVSQQTLVSESDSVPSSSQASLSG